MILCVCVMVSLTVSNTPKTLFGFLSFIFDLTWVVKGVPAFLSFILCIIGNSVLYIYSLEKSKGDGGKITCTAIPYRASTGPEQGFPCVVNYDREKPVFITGNPRSHCRDPVFYTGNSLRELLHREIPVVITGNGFAV